MRNLKPDMNFDPHSSDISFFAYTPVVDGRIVCISGFPTGGNLDDPNAEISAPNVTPQFGTDGLAGTIPAGIVMQETIAYDNTRMACDMSDFELRPTGIKAAVYCDGWCVTRCIKAGEDLTTIAGKPAYYDELGNFTTATGSPRVGTFQSNGDPDGYVRVWINRLTHSTT